MMICYVERDIEICRHWWQANYSAFSWLEETSRPSTRKSPVSWQRSINTFLICCLKLLAYLCRIDILICSLRTSYRCNYTLIFSARERVIQASTDHVSSPCTPCCILCFWCLHHLVFYNLNYFGSLAGFQSACSFTFLKLCWFPECKCLRIF